MTEKERFEYLGLEAAKKLESAFQIQITDELKERMTKFKYLMFCADCSDDYSRTLSEQHDLREELSNFLVNLEYKKELVIEIVRRL